MKMTIYKDFMGDPCYKVEGKYVGFLRWREPEEYSALAKNIIEGAYSEYDEEDLKTLFREDAPLQLIAEVEV